jgi:hypothetical protein
MTDLFDGSWIRTGFGAFSIILLMLGVVICFRQRAEPYTNRNPYPTPDGEVTVVFALVIWLAALFWPNITTFLGSL